MEKEKNLNQDNTSLDSTDADNEEVKSVEGNEDNPGVNETKIEPTPEEKIIELEDKLARSFAEMENQRRRFEKEKDDAFDYGGFSFAKEALNLIDNLERSKLI